MSWKVILHGIGVSLICFLIGLLLIVVLAYFLPDTINAGRFGILWMALTPFCGGLAAGWRLSRQVIRHGAMIGLLLFILALAFMIWFLPDWFNWLMAAEAGLVFVALGAFGSLWGLNFRKAGQVLDSKEKK